MGCHVDRNTREFGDLMFTGSAATGMAVELCISECRRLERVAPDQIRVFGRRGEAAFVQANAFALPAEFDLVRLAPGYAFAGTQYRNQCFCGNDFGKYGSAPDDAQKGV